MGRRKIEIKAIKDERNRSVTFLKRKGGLFKKAHELSVLCSVDVAVIIFGQNKKLYEYSSGDIREIIGRYQYYGNAHEHKGPADFAGKGGQDDDDEEDDNIGSPGPEESDSKYEPSYPSGSSQHPLPGQPGMQHINQTTPAPSPPMPNGAFTSRLSTPQPRPGSRPQSRTHSRRPSSNLAPQTQPPPHQQAPHPQVIPMGYNYQPNAGFYSQQAPTTAGMQMQHQQNSAPLLQQPFQPPQMSHQQVQQWYMQDQRRQSMPSNFPIQGHQSQPNHPQATIAIHSPPQPPRPFQSPTLPEPHALNPSIRSHSIYTPVDDNRSILAQHWGVTGPAEGHRNSLSVRMDSNMRSQSIDVGAAMRNRRPSPAPPVKVEPSPQPAKQPLRTSSTSGLTAFAPPTRTPSMSSSDVKRPRLKVQIPNEQSDTGSVTGTASPKETPGPTSLGTPAKSTLDTGHSVIKQLPPPQSPNASAILSAGPTGPKNPFARPPPPSTLTNNNNSSYKDVETPMSALPSRFIYDGLLPSPSTFYPEWGLGSNSVAPSPQIYQPTPINMNGPSFRDEDFDRDRKRKQNDESEFPAPKREKP